MKKVLLLFLLIPFLNQAQQFDGIWHASFQVMGVSMRMTLHINEAEKSIAIENPDIANVQPFMCDEVVIEETHLEFVWNTGGLTYAGDLKNGIISGVMRQKGMQWDVQFKREEQEKIVVNRPQEPKAPFPYTSETMQIENGEIQLGATLVLPEHFDTHTPIVILVSGTGAQNRDCAIAGHKLFLVIADHLARNNIASVRFDDRGIGTSTTTSETTLMDYGSDVEAIARYLRKNKKFKKNPLGTIGHSEGGMHTLIAASNYKKIDFLIQLATVGVSGKNVLVTQQYAIPKAAGDSEALCQWNRDLFATLSDIVLALPQKEAADSIQTYLSTAWDTAPPSYDKSATNKFQFVLSMNSFMNNQWMREFLAFETADYLNKLNLPLLAIHAGKDVQVSPTVNSQGFESYDNAETHIIDGLNHLLQPCETCDVAEYGAIDTTISKDVLHLMTTWILGLN